jgi:capsular polysaccharide transport system permease protein
MSIANGSASDLYRRLLRLGPRRDGNVAVWLGHPRLGGALRRLLLHRALRWTVVFLPTLLAGAYFFLVAADQYESEARFIVRSAARPEVPGGLALLVQLGLGRSQDDSFIVQDYLTSRDAIDRLQTQLPLREMFNREGADFLARYPSVLYGPRAEQFYRYFQHMVSVVHVDKTGISTLRVSAFNAVDAHNLAETLLGSGEELVNRINHRLQTDAVGNSLRELQTAQQRMVDAQIELTNFRNRELILDPARSAVALAELIARLSSELGATQAQVAEMRSGAAASPQLLALQRKASALEEQIARERARVASGGDDLAGRIAVYERLSLEREFANRMVGAAEAELVRSRTEAARQLLYLERIVEPNLADYPTQPKRVRSVLTIFAVNLLILLICWLIWSGVREHAQ